VHIDIEDEDFEEFKVKEEVLINKENVIFRYENLAKE
jgi:hypothetical protein